MGCPRSVPLTDLGQTPLTRRQASPCSTQPLRTGAATPISEATYNNLVENLEWWSGQGVVRP